MIKRLLAPIVVLGALQFACASRPSLMRPDSLSAFRSEAELKGNLGRLADEMNRNRQKRELFKGNLALESVALTDAAVGNSTDAITNTQHQGVDEGD